MYLHQESSDVKQTIHFVKRQGPPPSNSTHIGTNTGPSQQDQQGSQTWMYIVVAVIIVVLLTIALIFTYMRLRKLKIAGRSPKYIPTKYLKGKWEAWKPKGKYSNIERSGSESEPTGVVLRNNTQTRETTANVDRRASIRSIISLPAYSFRPKENEEVIGREGERAGIDTVLELPETGEEEEERRETEMESLFQIRQARRREIAEREERRRERREARERNDWTRLEELRRESRARREQTSVTNLAQASVSNVNLTAEMLIAEHNSRGRDRRVSSVSYAQLGQVRHDGTRIRSNSRDSERSGLLNGAAPMGTHNRNGSETTLLTLGGLPQPRYRDRSNSAATTISVSASSFENVTSPNELSRPLTARTVNSHRTSDSISAISEISDEEADIGSERLTTLGTDSENNPQPPEYDGHDWGQAPDYMSRANSTATARSAISSLHRAPSSVSRLSTISRNDTLSILTPSIIIEVPTGPNTPVTPRTNQTGFSTDTESTPRP